MATIAGVDLGKIQREGQGKDSGLFEMPLPASDSDDTFLLDLFGATKRMTLDGVFTGTKSEINTFIVAIEGIVDGDQATSTFVSSLSTYANKTVLIKNFNWNWVGGQPNLITYTLELIEGS